MICTTAFLVIPFFMTHVMGVVMVIIVENGENCTGLKLENTAQYSNHSDTIAQQEKRHDQMVVQQFVKAHPAIIQ
jgi:hypothetical protein